MSSFLVCKTKITGSFQLILFTVYVSIKLSKSKSSPLYPYQLNQSGLGLGFGLALCCMCEIDRPEQKERQPSHLYYSVCWEEFSCWAIWIKTFRSVLIPSEETLMQSKPTAENGLSQVPVDTHVLWRYWSFATGEQGLQAMQFSQDPQPLSSQNYNSPFWPYSDSRKVSTSFIPVQWGHSHLQRFIETSKQKKSTTSSTKYCNPGSTSTYFPKFIWFSHHSSDHKSSSLSL